MGIEEGRGHSESSDVHCAKQFFSWYAVEWTAFSGHSTVVQSNSASTTSKSLSAQRQRSPSVEKGSILTV